MSGYCHSSLSCSCHLPWFLLDATTYEKFRTKLIHGVSSCPPAGIDVPFEARQPGEIPTETPCPIQVSSPRHGVDHPNRYGCIGRASSYVASMMCSIPPLL